MAVDEVSFREAIKSADDGSKDYVVTKSPGSPRVCEEVAGKHSDKAFEVTCNGPLSSLTIFREQSSGPWWSPKRSSCTDFLDTITRPLLGTQ